MCKALLGHFFPKLMGASQAESYHRTTDKVTGRTARAGRTPGDAYISKTMAYSVDYSPDPEERSGSLVHLVDVPPSMSENASARTEER